MAKSRSDIESERIERVFKKMNQQSRQTKIKVYELDFGDTNLITKNKQDILDWINSEMHDLYDEDKEGITFTITTKLMSRRAINNLPEWS